MGSERERAALAHAKHSINRRVKGYVTREFTFHCGACSCHNAYAETVQALATDKARAEGWRWTAEFGWVCPAHRVQRSALPRV